jgi:DNA-directed RNA polymerase alpha subunit
MMASDRLDDLVSTLHLQGRASVCLRDAKIVTVRQLLGQSEAMLRRLPRFGAGCLADVKESLSREGFPALRAV